jgi:hypothetical protein
MKAKKVKEVNQPDGAHGYTKLQFARKHETADAQLDKGDYKSVVKRDRIAERHVVPENGFVTAKRRADAVVAARKAGEANIVSLRKKHHTQSINLEGGKGRVPFSNKK